jgi:hypothetical protein
MGVGPRTSVHRLKVSRCSSAARPDASVARPQQSLGHWHLTVLASCNGAVGLGGGKSHRSDLNRRPLDYESRALPLSYGGAIESQQLTTLVERSTPWCQWRCQNPLRAAPPTAPLT